MMVPRKALDKPQPTLICSYAGEVALESGSDVVRIRKVESLGHIHLTEHREQPLFLDDIVDLVIERYWKHIRAFQVVEVVPANEGNDCAFRDEDHVPSRSKLDETCPPYTR